MPTKRCDRAGVPLGTTIFAEEALLDEAAVEPAIVDEGDDEEAILDEFRDFLDDIRPDDFASSDCAVRANGYAC